MQRNKPVLIAAVILGLLALGLTAMSLMSGGSSQQAPVAAAPTVQPKTTRVVATREIPSRTKITRNLVHEEELPAGAPGEAAPVKMDEVLGKLSADLIPAGKSLSAADLTNPIKRTTPANFAIPAGFRAVAVMIDKTQTMGDIVDVGDHVDVIVVHKIKYKDQLSQMEGESKSGRTIAQNLLVLATDPALKQVPAPPPAAAPGDPNAQPPTPTPPPPPPPPGQAIPKLRVVLAAPAAEAERIAAAQEQGNIHLTVRDPNGVDVAPVPEAIEYPITMAQRTKPAAPKQASVTRESAPKYPEMAPPQLQPMPTGNMDNGPAGAEVTVIRGTEKTRVIVPQN